jgi:hypothetical protein
MGGIFVGRPQERNTSPPPKRDGLWEPQSGLGVDLYIWSASMNGLIYLVGLVVVIMAVLSFFGMR